MYLFESNINGINFGMLACCAVFNMMLYFAVHQKKLRNREMKYYEYFILSSGIGMFFEASSYLLWRNVGLIWLNYLINVVTFAASALSSGFFMMYIIQYYHGRGGQPLRRRTGIILQIYLLLTVLIFSSSVWNHWFFYITPEGGYHPGPIALLPAAMIVLPISGCGVIVWQYRQYSDRISNLLFGFYTPALMLAGLVDALCTLSLHYVVVTWFVTMFYIFVELKNDEYAAALEQASQSKTVFLSNMSHDMRTPMNSIIGFANLAKKHVSDPERTLDYLDKISMSSRYLLSLINDILDMSRIENNKITLDEEQTRLEDTIDYVDLVLRDIIQSKQQSFSIDLSMVRDRNIIVDRLRLNQILINLLSNATKYTQNGGDIRLTVTQAPCDEPGKSLYEFCVKDNGIGMSKEFLEHVFESFSRERSSTTSGVQGSGLGMAITQKIVDIMGGTIAVYSEQGKGTVVTVRLPLKCWEKPVEQKAQVSAVMRKAELGPKNLLLVEDNELNQEIAVELLEDEGFTVEVADDGDIALEMVKAAPEGRYDLILMDIQMPRMNGLAAARAIRALGRSWTDSIPIIAMSANAFQEDRDASLAAGMNDHIAKPVDADLLMEYLAKYLS